MWIKYFCPEHGKLGFENVVVRGRVACCKKCGKALQFRKVKSNKT